MSLGIILASATPQGNCTFYADAQGNFQYAQGSFCQNWLSKLLNGQVAPYQETMFAAVAFALAFVSVTIFLAWRMGPLGRRFLNYRGDIDIMLFPNGTLAFYKMAPAFSTFMHVTAKKFKGLIKSGKDSTYPSNLGHIVHITEAVHGTDVPLSVASYTRALEETARGEKKFAGDKGPAVIPTNQDQAITQYFKERIQGEKEEQKANFAKLQSAYRMTYGEEIDPEVLKQLQTDKDPIAYLATKGGSYIRRFKELVRDMAAADPNPLWPIVGVSVDMRVVFRWLSSQDNPVNFKVAYQTGYEDGKADQSGRDRALTAVMVIVALAIAAAIVLSFAPKG